MVHHKQLSNNILPYNEGFEGKKQVIEPNLLYNLHILKSP